MGDKKLTTLVVALTATTGAFATAFKQAEGVAERFGSKLKSAIQAPMAQLTAFLTAGGVVVGLKETADRIDALAKAADRLGVSTQSLAGMQHAAMLAGVGAETLTTSMEKLSRTVQDAADGNAVAQKAIHDLGLRYSDLAAMAPDAQMRAVADAVRNLGTAGQRTAAVMAVFGKSGGQLIPLLRQGAGAFSDAADEATKFGTALSRADAAKVEEANDAISRAGEAIKGVFDRIMVRMAPFITAIATAFSDAAKESNGFASTIENVANFVIKAAGWIANAWQGLRIVWEALEVGVMRVASWIMDFGDRAVGTAQRIGTGFTRAWDVVTLAGKTMGAELVVVWDNVKLAFAHFVEFSGSKLAVLLDGLKEVASRLDDDVTAKLQSMSSQVAASTGSAVAEAKGALKDAEASATASANNLGAATKALFAPVVAEGSDALHALSQQYEAQAQKLNDKLAQSLSEHPASEKVDAFAAQTTAMADARANAAAQEISDEQAKQAALSKANAAGLKAREDAFIDFYAITQTAGYKYTQQTVGGMSSMFDNLSKLQESHDKRARAIGKAAAKAKIVTDTAAAAMASYQALAGIPYVGPYLGAAAAAAAIAAGVVQLGNVDKSDSGTIASAGGAPDVSTSNVGGISAPAQSGQTLILQGDSFSADSLVKLFDEAKERGYTIDGVRRG